jgi:protein-disulfide isomerase
MHKLKFVVTVLLLSGTLAACAGPAAVSPADNAPSPAVEDKRGTTASSSVAREAPSAVARPGTAKLLLTGLRRFGSREAKIGIVEFVDYECPYCRQFHAAVLPRLKTAYVDTGVVQYFTVDFPLKMHRYALPASIAANCAGEQGRYPAMQDRLFASNLSLGAALYSALARELGLDADKFSACLSERERQRDVHRQLELGRRLGVNSTPSFILGRIENDVLTIEYMAGGAASFESFVMEIDRLSK